MAEARKSATLYVRLSIYQVVYVFNLSSFARILGNGDDVMKLPRPISNHNSMQTRS